MIERYSLPEMFTIWKPENKFNKWLQIEILACEALSELGLIPKQALTTIKEKAQFNINRIEEIEQTTKHDVIAFLTNVAEYIGPESRYIHLGLTSSDILDTSQAILLKEASEIIISDINKLINTLKTQAYKYKNTIMIGRSHGIHAEPTTLGLKFTLWYSEMQRNLKRMKEAKETICYGKISGAVGTFANIPPFVEEYVCKRCGIKPAPISTQIIQRDRYAEFLATLAIIAGTIDKIAIEIRHLQRTEVLELEEPFTKGQKGSSAMPHKRNPIVSEQLSGLARIIRGNALAALESMPLWHERDISHSSVERIILPDSTILIDYMLQKINYLLSYLVTYPENMQKNLAITQGLIFSQRILLELTKKGVIREKAYELVQHNAMAVWRGEGTFQKLLQKDKEINKYLTSEDISKCFNSDYHLRHIDDIYQRVFKDNN